MFCSGCGSEIPDDAQSCPHCGEVLKTEEKRPIESPTIDSSSNPDFKLYLDGEAENVSLLQYLPSRFYFVVEKLSSAPISDVKVQLSGPPQIKLLIKSRKVSAKRMKNRFHFTISASEPGLFILTATLTSKVGHRIAFPIEVQVEPKYPNSVKSTCVRDLAPKSSSPEGVSITAIIIVGVIGVVLLLAGFLMAGSGMFALGISMVIFGVIIITTVFGIATKGQCCLVCCSG